MTNALSIQVQSLQKSFKDILALDDVTLHFESGKMHGIIGPSGAGKTTLMRCLLGLLKPNQGCIQFKEGKRLLSFQEIRDKTAYLPQTQSLYPDLSIEEHLNFFKALYQIPNPLYQKKRTELLEMTRLEPFLDRPAGALSGGMYKKLGLMCSLLRSPHILLLDEPTNGVDPISRREFWDLLYRLLDQNTLILVSTAYMDEAERCTVVHLLENGQVISEGEPKSLLKTATVSSFDAFFLKNREKHE